jgi:hypothetical protein
MAIPLPQDAFIEFDLPQLRMIFKHIASHSQNVAAGFVTLQK